MDTQVFDKILIIEVVSSHLFENKSGGTESSIVVTNFQNGCKIFGA